MTDIVGQILFLAAQFPPPKKDPTNWMENNYPMRWLPPIPIYDLTGCVRKDMVLPDTKNLT